MASTNKGLDFARAQLEKYGWEEGKGLGRLEDGRKSAIRPYLKFDKAGVGHNVCDEILNSWWQDAYNTASKRLSVKCEEDKVEVINSKANGEDAIKHRKPVTYSSFVKGGVVTNTCDIGTDGVPVETDEDLVKKTSHTRTLTDDELFKLCGGRTGHKAARHGHKMSGKLARLAEQEKQFMIKWGLCSETKIVKKDERCGERKKSKNKKNMYNQFQVANELSDTIKRKVKKNNKSENEDEENQEIEEDQEFNGTCDESSEVKVILVKDEMHEQSCETTENCKRKKK